MNEKQPFLIGAIILSIAGVVSRILGGIYRIPLARLIGDEGMALYQMAYPIYTTILALATAGIPVAISVLVARMETQGYTGDSRRILKISLIMLAFLGMLFTLLVIQTAHFLANTVLDESRAYYPILAVAPAIFFACLMSVFRGYFQGYQLMTPTAISQIAEQLVRVIALVVLAFMLFPNGLEYAVAGATSGAIIGGVAGLLVLSFYYVRFRRETTVEKSSLVYSGKSIAGLAKEVLEFAVPVSLGACVLPLVQLLDAIIVRKQLEAIAYSNMEATVLFGQLAGKAVVLVGLSTIFTIAIATSLVPAISEAFANNNSTLLKTRINSGYLAGAIVSFPCAAGLYILAFPICGLLYGTPEAGISLQPLAFSCITLAAFQISAAALQGIGRPEVAMYSLLITGFLKVVFNYTLTAIPALNIRGAAIGTVIAFLIGALINICVFKVNIGIVFERIRILRIALATLIMAVAVKVSYQMLLGYDIHSYIVTVLAIVIGISIYVIQLLILREIDFDMLSIKLFNK